jgi:hypothetical protein
MLIGLLAATRLPTVEGQAPAPARCACCTEPGTWSEVTRAITLEEYAEVGRLNFAAIATSPGGPGAGPPSQYRLVHHGRTRDWTLDLHGESGRGGTLKFTIPDRGTFFSTDVQDGKTTAGGGPLLYKELRVTGPNQGGGTFPRGTFRLVLQGRGGACPEAADFSSWILEVNAAGARVILFGKFERPRPR